MSLLHDEIFLHMQASTLQVNSHIYHGHSLNAAEGSSSECNAIHSHLLGTLAIPTCMYVCIPSALKGHCTGKLKTSNMIVFK